MSPAPHLLYVNSRPTLVSAAIWIKFYVEEHLADTINTGTAKTAAFYEELELPTKHGSASARKFLAIYQTDFAEPLKTANADVLMWTSAILSEGGKHTDAGMEHIDPDTRNYELVQVHDPKGVGEGVASALIIVEMQPTDVDDCDRWYREEYLHMLPGMPGYRRTFRYKKGPGVPFSKVKEVPLFLAVHEVDDALDAVSSEEWARATGTAWSKKVVADCKGFNVRGWKLVHAHGR